MFVVSVALALFSFFRENKNNNATECYLARYPRSCSYNVSTLCADRQSVKQQSHPVNSNHNLRKSPILHVDIFSLKAEA